MVILAVSVGIGGGPAAHLLYVSRPPPQRDDHGPAAGRPARELLGQHGHLGDLRWTDGTVVFYRLFDTAAEARADVVNGNELAPNGTPCPPSVRPSRRDPGRLQL